MVNLESRYCRAIPLKELWLSKDAVRREVVRWSAALLTLLIVPMTTNLADETTVCEQSSFWELSSRVLPDCPDLIASADGPAANLRVARREGAYWHPSSLENLLVDVNSEKYGRVIVYVHGNWHSPSDSRRRSAIVYAALLRRSHLPICFISYSWPSERKDGYARDVIGKKHRIDADSYYLADFISCLQPTCKLSFLGFSFGAKVCSGALHLCNGGVLAGRSLGQQNYPPHHMRVSFIAPAFERSALTRCGRYSAALGSIDALVNLYNSRDPILRRFRFFDRNSEPIAAGFAGLLIPDSTEQRVDQPLADDPKIRQYNCASVGRTHSELAYYECASIYRALDNVLAN